jgi:hypothetical protein
MRERDEWVRKTPPIEIWAWCATGTAISLALINYNYLPEALVLVGFEASGFLFLFRSKIYLRHQPFG